MVLKLLGQPYRESEFTGQTFITSALRDENVTRVLVITAWVRRSGMELLVPGIRDLRQRGGTSRLLVGVDLRGTSRQGVALARQHFDDVRVIHDPSGRTFHPKVYLALGDRVGYALVGSNNLTAGGLWHNYEAGLVATFDPRRDHAIRDAIDGYASRLLKDSAICKRLTRGVFDRLVAESWLADETRDKLRREDQPPRRPPRRSSGIPPLFSPSEVEKRRRPGPVGGPSGGRRIGSRTRRRLATAPDTWWKRLGAGDAQHPPIGHPTGNVALTDVPEGYDRATFFRQLFFAAEDWEVTVRSRDRRTEVATILADVEIGGSDLGRHDLTLVFRPYRSRRGRATTVMRWEALMSELRARNVGGWFLLIERGDDRAYRVRITPDQPA